MTKNGEFCVGVGGSAEYGGGLPGVVSFAVLREDRVEEEDELATRMRERLAALVAELRRGAEGTRQTTE